MVLIDWESSESHIFANPTLSSAFYPSKWKGFNDLPAHIWIATSGTTETAASTIKWVALSKKAFLASAYAVNQHLKITASDIWFNALPIFHVGGLSIYARSFLSQALVKTAAFSKWTPAEFIQAIKQEEATLTSLVPAQLFDLVQKEYIAPPSLRTVIIGGGHFPKELYEKAKALKWPVVPSFGMSECASQIATGTLDDFRLLILPHICCSTSKEGKLEIASDALFTGYLKCNLQEFVWEDPKINGIFITEDLVQIDQNILHFLGRASDVIKIGGENVSLFNLETYFNKIKPNSIDAFIHAAIDERLGKIIELVTLKIHQDEVYSLVESFNKGVMPYEKIRNVRYLESIPRSSLGKILKSRLR